MQHTTLEIEVALSEDTSGEYKYELVTEFARCTAEIKAELSRGLPPHEYAPLHKLLAAIETATVVVEGMWPILQQGTSIAARGVR